MSPEREEPLAARWLRRALTVSCVSLALGLTTALWPLAPLLLAIDALRGGALARTFVFLWVLLLCEVLGVAGALGVWLITAFGLRRDAWWRLNNRLQARWGATLYRAGERLYSVRTIVEGDVPAPGSGPLLCFVRHASTADTVLPVLILGDRAGFHLRYVLKRELLLDPCLDIVGHRLPNCFVRRGGERTDREARRVVELLARRGGMGPGDALVVFPEGTRYSERRRLEALARIESSGTELARALAPALTRTLSPLRQGALALLQANPGADLLVMAHTGLEPAATLRDILRGALRGQTVRVRLRRVPFAHIPADAAGQAELLARLWREVDEFVRLFTPPRT